MRPATPNWLSNSIGSSNDIPTLRPPPIARPDRKPGTGQERRRRLTATTDRSRSSVPRPNRRYDRSARCAMPPTPMTVLRRCPSLPCRLRLALSRRRRSQPRWPRAPRRRPRPMARRGHRQRPTSTRQGRPLPKVPLHRSHPHLRSGRPPMPPPCVRRQPPRWSLPRRSPRRRHPDPTPSSGPTHPSHRVPRATHGRHRPAMPFRPHLPHPRGRRHLRHLRHLRRRRHQRTPRRPDPLQPRPAVRTTRRARRPPASPRPSESRRRSGR
jgi:hypothetical protein